MKSKKPKIIILEGVTTTGKTTVFNNLKRFSEENNLNWIFVPEKETIIPIIDSENQENNNRHFLKLFKKYSNKKAEVYVFDRLHFSSIFKTGASIKDLRVVEDKLSEFDNHIFMMYLPKKQLKDRIIKSMNYRNISWSKYLLKKVGGRKEDVAKFYINRQEKVLKILKKSNLNIRAINTTNQNFVKATREIIDELGFKIKI